MEPSLEKNEENPDYKVGTCKYRAVGLEFSERA